MKSDQIGRGLIIWHGYSTVLNASVIGKDFQVWQNVTIGFDQPHVGGIPTIGDNVRIYTGAIVVGDITIGDNAIIGAGSFVAKNVPANAVVAGNPARIIKLNGDKVSPPQKL